MKKLIIFGAIAVVGLGVYYSGAYTYFVEKKINEEMPEIDLGIDTPSPTASTENQELEITPTLTIKTLKQGSFTDADFFHKGGGQAKILEYPDGRKILRFENFKVTNGPDLFVYLSATDSPAGSVDSLGKYIDLGQLKGNVGNQNYDLPIDIDINDYNSAVIWCKKFGVLFSYAAL